jgi:hypothetical protein
MSDIVTRLRNWRTVHLARLHLLMDEAADEMERLSANGDCPDADNAANGDNEERLAALQALTDLDEELGLPSRTPATHATPSEGSEQDGCTLTDEERAAISRDLSWLQWCEDNNQIGDVGRMDIATLRGLLERLA